MAAGECRLDGVICYICNQPIPKGTLDWTYSRSGEPRMWHKSCENGGAVKNGATENAAQTKPKPKPEASAGGWLDGLAEQLAPYIEDRISTKLDRDQVDGMVRDILKDAVMLTVTKVIVEAKATGETKDMGIQHKQFADLLNWCQVRHEDDNTHLNILLTGPAGTGKTYVAKQIAKALGREFYFTGCINTEYKLLGFIDAQGRVVCPAFRKAYVEGGVFLFDEIWRSLPAALMPFNTALAGTSCDFPDGCFERHPDFLCLGADNNTGLGADTKYTGHKQDASVLDRFVNFEWGIDEALEERITGHSEWCARVRQLRSNAERKGLDVLITPRASRSGAAALRRGIPMADVEKRLIASRMKLEQWRNIQ